MSRFAANKQTTMKIRVKMKTCLAYGKSLVKTFSLSLLRENSTALQTFSEINIHKIVLELFKYVYQYKYHISFDFPSSEIWCKLINTVVFL